MFIISHKGTGECLGARRSVVGLAMVAAALLSNATVRADGESSRTPSVHVGERGGVYVVSACFRVPQPRSVVRAVLTDYESIPRFMPGMKTSIVLERAPGRVVVQQEALSRFMMFSKRVYLLLDVTEEQDALAFRDRSGRSFRRYEGAWTLADASGGTEVTYRLTAEPSFDVPQMILKRLLGRDSAAMIDGLRGEMAARARVSTASYSYLGLNRTLIPLSGLSFASRNRAQKSVAPPALITATRRVFSPCVRLTRFDTPSSMTV